jgi:D-arginine dehydrogenase
MAVGGHATTHVSSSPVAAGVTNRGSLKNADVIVLGAGMAGASVASELAPGRRVILLETEDQPGLHATGRSAAMFIETYGNATVRALTRASRDFFERPPAGFAAAPLLSPRGVLIVADAPRLLALAAMLETDPAPNGYRSLDAAQAREQCPLLSPDWVAGGLLDESGHDMDVAAIHLGYLKLGRHAGMQLVTGTGETRIERAGDAWQVRTRVGTFAAPVLVNATGAWADQVAQQAGVPPIGLQPLRRTAVLLPAPAGYAIARWPMVIDVEEEFYFKPDAGKLLLSPANEDPMAPCDAFPDDIDVAIAVDRFENATRTRVDRVGHSWAGLRSFVADRSPVAGYDMDAPGFFWLAGQGGYGIQMAPALARAAAALVAGEPLPADIKDQGVSEQALSPARLAAS